MQDGKEEKRKVKRKRLLRGKGKHNITFKKSGGPSSDLRASAHLSQRTFHLREEPYFYRLTMTLLGRYVCSDMQKIPDWMEERRKRIVRALYRLAANFFPFG